LTFARGNIENDALFIGSAGIGVGLENSAIIMLQTIRIAALFFLRSESFAVYWNDVLRHFPASIAYSVLSAVQEVTKNLKSDRWQCGTAQIISQNNPLITILLALIFFRERFGKLQWTNIVMLLCLFVIIRAFVANISFISFLYKTKFLTGFSIKKIFS
jgi:hypothetical protein